VVVTGDKYKGQMETRAG